MKNANVQTLAPRPIEPVAAYDNAHQISRDLLQHIELQLDRMLKPDNKALRWTHVRALNLINAQLSEVAALVDETTLATKDVTMQTKLKAGDRVRLVSMTDDPDPIPAGTTGTVAGVYPHQGWMQVDVDWDNGRSLMLSIPPDVVAKIDDTPTTQPHGD